MTNKTVEQIVKSYERQFEGAIDSYINSGEDNVACAVGAGMLLILSAFRSQDGKATPIQVACMHTALRNVGVRLVVKNG
jgi:hypothetical protein